MARFRDEVAGFKFQSIKAMVFEGEEGARSHRRQRICKSISSGKAVSRIEIPRAHVVSDVVFYELEVDNAVVRWNLFKRYSEFRRMHCLVEEVWNSLKEKIGPGYLTRIPSLPKRVLKRKKACLSTEFTEKRRILLQIYLNDLLKVSIISNSDVFLQFLVPDEMHESRVPSRIPRKLITSQLSLEGESGEPIEGSPYALAEEIIREDEREITDVVIKNYQMVSSGRVVYQVHVFNTRKHVGYQEWTVLKSYSHFAEFDYELKSKYAFQGRFQLLAGLPPIPPRLPAMLFNHRRIQFIESRRIAFEKYLNYLISHQVFYKDPLVLMFLGV